MSYTIPFAHRTGWDLSSNPLMTQVSALKKNKTSFFDLTESNPTHDVLFQASQEDILCCLNNKNNAQYTPSSQGMLAAREAVSRYYKIKNINVSPEQIFLTANTSEAYSFVFRLLANPDDVILFPRPSYPLFSFLGDLNDLKIRTYPLVYQKRWRLVTQTFKEQIDPAVKAMVLVNPNNPTGSFIQPDELIAINQICRQASMAIISDEVFGDYVLGDGKDQVSLINNPDVLTFVFGGLSKALGLPQMKLSWIIISGPQQAAKEARARLEIIADTYLSVNTPVQNALSQWLAIADKMQGPIQARVRANWHFLRDVCQKSERYQLLDSDGGWYAVLKVPLIGCEEQWVIDCLEQERVFVHPGYFFDFDQDGHLVLSLLTAPDVFQEGTRRLIKRINQT